MWESVWGKGGMVVCASVSGMSCGARAASHLPVSASISARRWCAHCRRAVAAAAAARRASKLASRAFTVGAAGATDKCRDGDAYAYAVVGSGGDCGEHCGWFTCGGGGACGIGGACGEGYGCVTCRIGCTGAACGGEPSSTSARAVGSGNVPAHALGGGGGRVIGEGVAKAMRSCCSGSGGICAATVCSGGTGG